jgi:hypothetical protein
LSSAFFLLSFVHIDFNFKEETMPWKDDEFIRGSEGQGYGGPSMDEIAVKIQQKMARWGGKRIL